ncbi:hypothetical protein BH11PSE2_BH11PSE2_17130 [soil metagenome]
MATGTKPQRNSRKPQSDAPPALVDKEVEALPGTKGKLGELIRLLRRPEGAQISDLMAATGWQAHSVRGAISGSLKKKLGLTVTSEKSESGRTYRIISTENGGGA